MSHLGQGKQQNQIFCHVGGGEAAWSPCDLCSSLGYNETQAKSFPWRRALKKPGSYREQYSGGGYQQLMTEQSPSGGPPKTPYFFSQNDEQFIEDAIELQSITGHDHGAKTRRILRDSELMAGLQNGKLELLRPVDHRSEPLAEP